MFLYITLSLIAISFIVSILVVFACVRSAQLSHDEGMPATETFVGYEEKRPLLNNPIV